MTASRPRHHRLTGAVGHRGRDEERERTAVLPEHRPGVDEAVAVTAVDGEDDERPRISGAALQAGQRIPEREKIEATLPQMDDGGFEKSRRNDQAAAGVETAI